MYIQVDYGAYRSEHLRRARVAPINPAVSGCEKLTPATLAIELGLGTLSGTGSPEPSVIKDEGTGTPGPESPVSTSARTRERNSMALG